MNTSEIPTPPITLPFAVHEAGATVSAKIRIITDGHSYKYPFLLNFYYSNKDIADKARLKNIFTPRSDVVGYELGIPIPLLIKIYVSDASGEHLYTEITTLLGRGYADGIESFSREIEHIKLDSGFYRVTVQSLKNIPELLNVKVTFGIYNPRTK